MKVHRGFGLLPLAVAALQLSGAGESLLGLWLLLLLSLATFVVFAALLIGHWRRRRAGKAAS
jgi:hypothetical protein